jgi:hypothetical protein
VHAHTHSPSAYELGESKKRTWIDIGIKAHLKQANSRNKDNFNFS